ncbi:TPA: glutamate--tRNA ligase [Candidatus Woesearchaeota archaeon]|nr:glutamate--tRNA ligase [Candidatus Woesearchaeota archaeon]HIH32561.1 glutamate--tRNA ligase [Candidatus Woesearchaeota archaeon]HIH54896.1 glutamate--tRNA ligase [Candidatus Woesearchaeota archaeon]HIJ01745.1 glutamate--tRNA ligase [Candidatus Woesearchaeota archaeon]HIJ13941.1 glutamate--tRNA ligase [Candidatus Woesearchaeota archaeon]
MDINTLKKVIRKYALDNALKFNGKASAGAVVGKVIGELPEVKQYMKTMTFEVNELLPEINDLPIEKIREEIEKDYPELLEKKEKEERNIFAFLNIKSGDRVKTGYPPGPEKYPHIGHAKAALLNYLLAKQYNGTFVLRFEDTNPTLVKAEFYDVIQENLKWLGAVWDELMYASDHMELFYEFAIKTIKDGNAYMCFCDADELKKSREEMTACKHRSHSIEENLNYWKEFPSYEEGKATLRLKIDLEHKNTVMRDPIIFRIIKTPHARHGNKYSVWPNYDFQNAIMDGYFEITYRIRSKEFELRTELQRYIQKILGINITCTYELARFNLEGVVSQGRIIREKIQNGEMIGWDDPRLPTIVALRRRGFLPEAIKNFIISTGITKSESTLTWDDLIIQNKRILDKTAKRFFMMYDYEKIIIHNAPHQNIQIRLHPNNDEYGFRELEVENEFFILKSDLKELKDNELYRFMDCLNFRKINGVFEFDSLDYDKFKSEGKKIMHFLPAYGNTDIEILMDDATTIKGVAEHNIRQLKVNEVIQFERFGFCRVDAIEDHKGKKLYKFWFTHR